MLLRLPWLLSRKRLALAVVVDGTVFALVYGLGFQLRFGRGPVLSLALIGLLLFWVMSSYVVGRYHTFKTQGLDLLIDQASRGAAVLLLTLGTYLGYHWFTAAAVGVEDRRGFLLPVLLAFALLSGLAQLVVSWLVRQHDPVISRWWVLGPQALVDALDKELAWSRLPCALSRCSAHDLASASSAPDLQGIVVSFSLIKDPTVLSQLLALQNQGFTVVSLVGWCEQVLQRFPPHLLDGVDLLRGEFSLPLGSIQLRLKRLGDVVVSIVLLLLSSPLVLLAAVLIRLDDGGPVLYSQMRCGFAGRPFQIWKLRSMRVNAEQRGAQWVSRADPRITRIGRLLRVTRIDELPQLFSVLAGQMSLIGPRPERPEFETELERQIPHYALRHGLRPGLSGWAQVNYPYGASVVDAANKLSYDLYYLRNFSFWLDLLILVKTIRLVFNARGAVPVVE